MTTWFCTRKLIKTLKVIPVEDPEPASTTLGDWHANFIDTYAGALFVFSNNRTFVSVAIPASQQSQLESMFARRVANLLSMLGIPSPAIEREVSNIAPIIYTRARDRRQLGHLQNIVYQYQAIAEGATVNKPISLSDAEMMVAGMPHIGSFRAIPSTVIRKLFDPNLN
jgi:hypothetical protein